MGTNQPWNWKLQDDTNQTNAWPISRWLWELTVLFLHVDPLSICAWNSPFEALAHWLSVGELAKRAFASIQNKANFSLLPTWPLEFWLLSSEQPDPTFSNTSKGLIFFVKELNYTAVRLENLNSYREFTGILVSLLRGNNMTVLWAWHGYLQLWDPLTIGAIFDVSITNEAWFYVSLCFSDSFFNLVL